MKRLKILVIDDEEPMRNLLSRMLREHEVSFAADGLEGRIFFQEAMPDLVITDIVMPEQDGIEFIIGLRRSRRDLPIVAVSGGGRVSAQDYLAIVSKFKGVVTLEKPFTQDQLNQAIKEAFQKNSPSGA